MEFNNINHLHYWQPLLIQSQVSADKLPDMGLNLLLLLDDLLGVAIFLKRKYAELEG